MSSAGGIDLVILSVVALIQTIKHLNLVYREKSQLKTSDGKIHNVDVVVKDANNRDIGFKKQKDGSYIVIADSGGLTQEQLTRQNEFINKIKQRYAYNMILTELRKKGYQVAEEKKLEKNTIKLVARRWVS